MVKMFEIHYFNVKSILYMETIKLVRVLQLIRHVDLYFFVVCWDEKVQVAKAQQSFTNLIEKRQFQ